MTDTKADQTKSRFAEVMETLRGLSHNLRHGKDETRSAEVRGKLAETDAGKDLLDLADKHGVPLRFMRMDQVGSLGSLSKKQQDDTVSISVANTGDAPQMTLTLFHELRHLLQQREQGDIKSGIFQSLKNPRRSHILSMMQEADAFTSEAAFALDRHAAGDKTYLDTMMNSRHDLARVSAKYIKNAPVSYAEKPEAFRRGLFTHIMLTGLTGYSASYFMTYAALFSAAQDKKQLQELIGGMRELGQPPAGSPLLSGYGSGYMAGASMTAMEKVFFRTLPDAEQQALHLMDKTVQRLPHLTEAEFQKFRGAAKDALLSIYMTDPDDLQYSNRSLHVRRAVTVAAMADVPDIRAAFAKAAMKIKPAFVPAPPKPPRV